ncbi:MAG: hypothetical protein NTW24_01185, partial [Proteobacteria bacterium]|nr:hypothetical protein [Pseudomonadota bacterium]
MDLGVKLPILLVLNEFTVRVQRYSCRRVTWPLKSMLRFFWRFSWRHINNLTKFALLCALLLLLAGAGVLLTLRYWVLPDIERYHDSIVSVVSDVVGQPVTIGKIQADWRGIRPHLALIDVLILDKQ